MLRIPDAIPLDAAAPLLCAGITLYSPLRHWNAGPGQARSRSSASAGSATWASSSPHAMGAKVTVLSQSLKKMEDGLRLGADEYYATTDPKTFEKLAGSFDLILNTVSANLDLDDYLGLLDSRRHAGRTGHARDTRWRSRRSRSSSQRRSLAGSMIGGIAETQEMLDFCAEHDVRPEIEVIAAGLHQRGLRARARQRRAVPLRHRHRSTLRR